MTTIALQLGREGLSWCGMPLHLTMDGDNPLEAHGCRWPQPTPFPGGTLPPDLEARIAAYMLVLQIVGDADDILVAVEPDADQRLVGAVDVALEAPGCYVIEVEPHSQGALGIMRAHIKEMLRDSPPPPGM